MTKRYQHITAPVRRGVAKHVGSLLWQAPERPEEDPDDGRQECWRRPPEDN